MFVRQPRAIFTQVAMAVVLLKTEGMRTMVNVDKEEFIVLANGMKVQANILEGQKQKEGETKRPSHMVLQSRETLGTESIALLQSQNHLQWCTVIMIPEQNQKNLLYLRIIPLYILINPKVFYKKEKQKRNNYPVQ